MYRIAQGISLGRFASQQREAELLAAGITHILNVSDVPSAIVSRSGALLEVAWVPMSDSRRLMDSTAVMAIDALHRLVCEPQSHVYVHCVAGVIRSPTVLWLYLIACGLPPQYAREMIESRSPGSIAGHPAMATDEHVALVQRHGRRYFSPHPRRDAIEPFVHDSTSAG